MEVIRPHAQRNRVYCAGPLFNAAERREMSQIAEVLQRAGFETFLPHADGLEFARVLPELIRRGWNQVEAGQKLHEAIFALDAYQVIVGCGSLVFNMNGRTPDEGAVAEAAMAWTLGKPVVIYKDDERSKIAGRDNPLVIGMADFLTVGRLDEIGQALQYRFAQCNPRPDEAITCPRHLRETLKQGEDFHNCLAQASESEKVERIVNYLNAAGRASSVCR